MIIPKKSLGQNFLSDENVARNIVERLNPEADHLLMEIGAGTGALTKHLVGTVRDLIVVEIDRRATDLLKERFSGGCRVLQEDILAVDPDRLVAEYGRPLRVVGNIPYYITSEILFWMFDHRPAFRDATLMMQLEVARRLVAVKKTKEYGILSIFTRFYTEPEMLFRVSRNSFFPRPNVDSAVIRLTFRKDVPAHNEHLLRSIVRGTFGKRRKMLHNSLRSMGFPEEQLAATGMDLKKRPEEWGIEEFLELTGRLGKKSRDDTFSKMEEARTKSK